MTTISLAMLECLKKAARQPRNFENCAYPEHNDGYHLHRMLGHMVGEGDLARAILLDIGETWEQPC